MNPQPKPITADDFKLPAVVPWQRAVVPRRLGITRGAVNIPIQNTVRPAAPCGPVEIALHATASDIFHNKNFKASAPDHAPIPSVSPDRFCFAPLEERVLIVGTHQRPEAIKQSKLELYCRVDGQVKKFWTKTYTWRKCPPYFRGLFSGDLGPGDEKQEKLRYPGDLESVKVVTDGGVMAQDFPDNVVTVARSPYMLRFSVVPILESTPVTEKAVWLYFDILPHSLTLHWGPKEMLTPRGADVEGAKRAETLRLEKEVVLDLLTKANADPMKPRHEVVLDATHLNGNEVAAVLKVANLRPDRRGTGGTADLTLLTGVHEDVTFTSGTPLETQKENPSYKLAADVTFPKWSTGPIAAAVTLVAAQSQFPIPAPSKVLIPKAQEFESYKAVWGDGPRIPILAKLRVKTSSGAASTTDDALKAVGPAECLWDWEDNATDTKIRDWVGTFDYESTALTRDFLEKQMKGDPQDADAAPLGSNNCPVKFGGKRGVGATPVFQPAEQGAFPFPVTPAGGNRPWAAYSKCGTGDNAGKTGVLFQPSRMQGDRYRLVVYVVMDRADFDLKDVKPDKGMRDQFLALRAQERPKWAVTGEFEIFRRVKVTYYSFPANTPGSEKMADAAVALKQVAGIILDVADKGAPPPSFTKKENFDAAHKKKYGDEGDVQLFLYHLWKIPQAQPNATHFLHTNGFPEYQAAVKNHFKTQPIFAVTVSDGDPFQRGKDPVEARFVEVKSSGGAEGFVVALDPLLTDELAAPVILLLSKNGTAFRQGETLTTIETAPKTSQIKKVLTEASGFIDFVVKLGDGTDHKVVDVNIAGTNVKLTFPKKTFSSNYSKQMTTDHKTRLKTALVNAVNGRQTPLPITVSGDRTDPNGGLRVSRVRGFIQAFFRNRVLIDRAEVWSEYCAAVRSYHKLPYFEMHAKKQVEAIFNSLLEKFSQGIKTEKGIYFFYFENFSKATYFVEGGVQAPLGSPEMAVVYVVIPKPPHLTPRQQFLPVKDLLVHELAHAFFINHNYKRAFETGAPDGTGSAEIPEHVEHDTCVMNYDPDDSSQQFCGKCVLRLRGWNQAAIVHKVDYDEAKRLIQADVATAGANAGWVHIRQAMHLLNGAPMQDAIKKNSKKWNDFKWDRRGKERAKEPWKSVYTRFKELENKKDRTKKEEQEFANLKVRNDEIENSVMEPLTAIAALGVTLSNDVRLAARPLVAEAEKAWVAFSGSNAVGPGLGINMLRNMVLVHARYGDADKARVYYNQLTQLSTHGLDLTGGNLDKDINSTSPLHHILDLDNIDTSYYEVKVEIGDMSDIFANPVTTPAGRKARLQVLGLFGRPLNHPESDDCLTFSWNYAKTLFPTLQDNDPANVLDQEIKKFLISTGDGKLPLAGTPAARLRLAAGYGPMYSQTSMMLNFPEWDFPRSKGYQEGKHEDEKAYARYSLGGDPYEVEDIFCDANPALGKIPLKITVRKRPISSDSDGDYVPAANVRFYMQLVEPDTLDAGSFVSGIGAANPVAGGSSYSTGAEPTALAGKPAQFLKTIDERMDKTHPSLSGDPQAFNKSSHIGGKGRLHADGNITDPNDKIVSSTGVVRENLLLLPAGNGVCGPFDVLPTSKNEPHTISFDLDGNGEAKVVFAPSRVGGDRYKFRFYVGRPTFTGRNDSNSTETATMVVWRTARISAYLKQEPHTSAGDVAPYLQAQVTQPGAPKCLKTPPAPLTDIDFSAEMTKELAKCYVELVVDPRAQASRKLSTQSANFRNYVLQMERDYPWFVNCTYAQRFFKVLRNRDGKPWDPTTQRILREDEMPLGSYMYSDSACWLKELVTGTGKTGTATALQVNLRWAPFASSIKLVDFSSGEGGKSYIECAIEDPVAMTGTVGFTVKPPLASAQFSYSTKQLSLTFQNAAGAQPNYEVYYQGQGFVDIDAVLIDFPAKSPFLFNLRMPADYNVQTNNLHGTQYPPMLKATEADFFGNRPYPHVGYFDDRVGGLVKTVFMEGLAKAIDNNHGFYPGLVIVQAVELDNWGAQGMQDGKAVGRVVYLLNSKLPQSAPDVKVLLHEMAHALFLQHAPEAPGKQSHLHDPDDGCVMNYGTPANDGDFCGQCVAALRGLNAGDEPFVPSPPQVGG